MIAHVAQAGEDKGRVVVRLGAFAPSSPAAITAAVHVAKAFQSEIEGLFIEDPELAAAAALGSIREIACAGAARRTLSPAGIARDTGFFALAVQRQLAQAVSNAGITLSAQNVRDELVAALQAACSERGPWNIIVFAEPLTPGRASDGLTAAFEKVWGTTGYVAAAPNAAWRKGPIVVAVEDTDRLAGMVRAAERLAAVAGDEVWLMPVGEDDIALDWLESEIRLTLGETPVLKIMPRPEHAGCQQVSLATLTRCTPRMVVARYGGVMLPAKKLALALADAGCPCFLVH